MTVAAWLMMILTCSVIVFFTGRFFWMVLVTPHLEEDYEATRDGILSKDA